MNSCADIVCGKTCAFWATLHICTLLDTSDGNDEFLGRVFILCYISSYQQLPIRDSYQLTEMTI